jgi:hypothetical protein
MLRSGETCLMAFGSDCSDSPGTVIGENLGFEGSSASGVGPSTKSPGLIEAFFFSIFADNVPGMTDSRGSGQGRLFSRGQFTGPEDGRPVVIFLGSCNTLISVKTASVMPANGESNSGVPKSSFSLGAGAGVGMAIGDDGSGMELAESVKSSWASGLILSSDLRQLSSRE